MTASATSPAVITPGANAFRRYLLALLLGVVLALGFVAAILRLLEGLGTLPPPQITNSLCLDEKLAFMRSNPPGDPDLLVVGSSVAWRHFNSPVAKEAGASLRPYNAGFCGTSIGQTEAVTQWLVGRLPSVRQAVLVASPVDFSDCSAKAPSNFDTALADRYVFGNRAQFRLYFDHFDMGTLLGNARHVRAWRSDMTSYESLFMNGYGDAPLQPRQARELLYGAATFDPACFAALRRTANFLAQRGIAFQVAFTPMNPAWQQKFDPNGQAMAAWQLNAAKALSGTGGLLRLPDRPYPQDAFFDAIHLRASYTPEFTRSLAASLQ